MGKLFTITEGLENLGALKTGGQGSVYKGKRTGAIYTAVKLLPTPIHIESLDDKNYRDFYNEVQKLKRVNEKPNPNVVKILNAGITDTGNFPFIEMEFIEGPDLEELLQPPHPKIFTIKEAIKLAEHLSNALAHSHALDVKHGDVKSNNVKFNAHSGNYVLLDFGMAAMSDEQRRTSLRQAGAIEFMAPEQNEAKMLFQTDVYSFGIIMFELLAGSVPFPLTDRGEMARNQVMLAHMESPVPDLLKLRSQNLPEAWNEETKKREMQVPEWLLRMVDKCLAKSPDARFVNGIELHNYILSHIASPAASNEFATSIITQLQQENAALRSEKEILHQRLMQVPQQGAINTVAHRSGSSTAAWLVPLFLIIICGALVFYFKNKSKPRQVASTEIENRPVKPRPVVGQYKVMAARAYFHNEPNQATRRNAWLIPSNDVITALDEKNGFIYTEFTNNNNQTSKGWIKKSDLITLDEWRRQDEERQAAQLKQDDINTQLHDARNLLANGQVSEALYIYDFLAQEGVPEAMYEWGNLALQRKNDALSCTEGWAWVEKAADKNYAPAKRTLGFLYLFADSPDVLRMNDYEGCTFNRDVFKGSKLLMEAVAAGDSTAKILLDRFNRALTDSTAQ